MAQIAVQVSRLATRCGTLKGIDAVVKPGEVLFVIGHSGAGKACLLEAIEGSLPPEAYASGGVYYLQKIKQKHTIRPLALSELCRSIYADVPFHPGLTVKETLTIAAGLRLPSQSTKYRKEVVNTMLDRLGLRSCTNTSVGSAWTKGISSGESRRLAIACGLIGSPPVIVMHEPTGKLDSSLAANLIFLLRRIARKEKKSIIVSVSHVTSQMFLAMDKVLILREGIVQFCGFASTVREAMRQNEEGNLGLTKKLACFSPEQLTKSDLLGSGLFSSLCLEGNNLGAEEAHQVCVCYNRTPCPTSTKMTCFKMLVFRHILSAVRALEIGVVPILIHLLFGVLLGGLFWQRGLSVSQGPVETVSSLIEKAYPFITEAPAADVISLFTDGLGGSQPILDALENGVDGAKSQPLLEALGDKKKLTKFVEWVACSAKKIPLDNITDVVPGLVYPAISVPDKVGFDYQTLATSGGRIAQAADLMNLKLPWHLIALDKSSPTFWEDVTPFLTRFAVNPAFYCAGLPYLPVDGWGLFLEDESEWEEWDDDDDNWRRRLQVSFVEQAESIVFGTENQLKVDKLKEEVSKLGGMSSAASAAARPLIDETTKAITGGINTLGAVFIFVGTLPNLALYGIMMLSKERLILRNEDKIYGRTVDIMARFVAAIPIMILSSIAATVPFTLLTGLTISGLIPGTCLVLATIVTSYLLTLLLTELFGESATSMLTPLNVLLMTTSGFFLREADTPQWVLPINYINFLQFSFNGMIAAYYPGTGHISRFLPTGIIRLMASERWLYMTPSGAIARIIFSGILFLILTLLAGLRTLRRVTKVRPT